MEVPVGLVGARTCTPSTQAQVWEAASMQTNPNARAAQN
jgi:hypothetical protein